MKETSFATSAGGVTGLLSTVVWAFSSPFESEGDFFENHPRFVGWLTVPEDLDPASEPLALDGRFSLAISELTAVSGLDADIVSDKDKSREGNRVVAKDHCGLNFYI